MKRIAFVLLLSWVLGYGSAFAVDIKTTNGPGGMVRDGNIVQVANPDTDILVLWNTTSGAGGGLDAGTLNGEAGSFYQNLGNATGVLDDTELSNAIHTNSYSMNSFDHVSSNHTVTPTDYIELVDAADGDVTITLPAIASTQAGRQLRFKKTDSTTNKVIVDGDGSETIDGALTKTLISENQGMMIINDGIEWKLLQLTGRVSSFKSYAIAPASAGTTFFAGFYHGEINDSNLTQAAPTGAHGSVNQPEAARAFWVSGGAGSASGGAGTVTIVVSGTSITDAGVRTGSDSEVIVPDITATSLNEYFQTDTKWIGTVTFTLTCTGGCTHTTFNADGNIGHAKFEDFGNSGRLGFTVTDFEIVGQAGANDTGFDVDLVHHDCTNWTYAATGFVPGNGDIASLDTDYGAESDLTNGEFFAYKRDNLNTDVDTAAACKQGILGKVVTGANNAIDFATAHIGVRFP